MTNRVNIADVPWDERSPAHEALMPGGQIVEDHGRIACPVEGFAGVRPHITRATSHKDGTCGHDQHSSLSIQLASVMAEPSAPDRLRQPIVQNRGWSW